MMSFEEHPRGRGGFTLSPLCRHKKSNKTLGNSKSNTQQSRHEFLLATPACLPAMWTIEREVKWNLWRIHRNQTTQYMKECCFAHKCLMVLGFSLVIFFLMSTVLVLTSWLFLPGLFAVSIGNYVCSVTDCMQRWTTWALHKGRSKTNTNAGNV